MNTPFGLRFIDGHHSQQLITHLKLSQLKPYINNSEGCKDILTHMKVLLLKKTCKEVLLP